MYWRSWVGTHPSKCPVSPPKPTSVLWCSRRTVGRDGQVSLVSVTPTFLRRPPVVHNAGSTASAPCVAVRLRCLVLQATLRKVTYWVINLIFHRLIIVMIFLVDYMLWLEEIYFFFASLWVFLVFFLCFWWKWGVFFPSRGSCQVEWWAAAAAAALQEV